MALLHHDSMASQDPWACILTGGTPTADHDRQTDFCGGREVVRLRKWAEPVPPHGGVVLASFGPRY